MRGAALTSSYEEERAAAEAAIDWIRSQPDIDPDYKILIATDSQSLCKAIMNRSMAFDKILSWLWGYSAPEESAACKRCNSDIDDLNHWLSCSKLKEARKV